MLYITIELKVHAIKMQRRWKIDYSAFPESFLEHVRHSINVPLEFTSGNAGAKAPV